jgi:hypothetical protein
VPGVRDQHGDVGVRAREHRGVRRSLDGDAVDLARGVDGDRPAPVRPAPPDGLAGHAGLTVVDFAGRLGGGVGGGDLGGGPGGADLGDLDRGGVDRGRVGLCRQDRGRHVRLDTVLGQPAAGNADDLVEIVDEAHSHGTHDGTVPRCSELVRRVPDLGQRQAAQAGRPRRRPAPGSGALRREIVRSPTPYAL